MYACAPDGLDILAVRSASHSEIDVAGRPRAALRVLGRRHRGERPELTDEMGLIEVTQVGCNSGAACLPMSSRLSAARSRRTRR